MDGIFDMNLELRIIISLGSKFISRDGFNQNYISVWYHLVNTCLSLRTCLAYILDILRVREKERRWDVGVGLINLWIYFLLFIPTFAIKASINGEKNGQINVRRILLNSFLVNLLFSDGLIINGLEITPGGWARRGSLEGVS